MTLEETIEEMMEGAPAPKAEPTSSASCRDGLPRSGRPLGTHGLGPDGLPRAEFHITDEAGACWVLQRLAAIEAEKALVATQARRRLEELEADRNRLMGRFGAELEVWAREEAERRRRRTVTTMYGTLAFRTVPARLEITDPQSAADVAITLGLVRPAAPDLVAYKKRAEEALAETGELLPGVGMSEARESFAVRLPRAGGGEARGEGLEVAQGDELSVSQ